MNACPVCHGDGYIYDPSVSKEAPVCRNCNGTGIRPVELKYRTAQTKEGKSEAGNNYPNANESSPKRR